MKCCICGCEINGYGNNPFPLCHTDDYESRCCDLCDMLVVKARMAKIGHTNTNIVPWNSTIAILWSKNSDKPIESLRETGKILAGQVTEIDKNKGIMRGNWGDFSVDIKDDNYFDIDN